MEELIQYRKQLLDRFTADAREFREACLAVKDPFAAVEGGWNVRQLAAHTRDVNQQVYGLRARRTLQEENPEFQNFDGDLYLAEHYRREEPLRTILEELVVSVDGLVAELRSLPPEAWTRESRHATQGTGLTLQLWVERGLGHLREHLATIKKAL